MRVVVTGAGGFIGSHLCEALLDDGHEVVGIEGFIPSYPRQLKLANLRTAGDHPRFRLVRADLRTDPLADALHGADAVVNAAAMIGLQRSWTDIDLFNSCNFLALQRLLAACQTAEVGKLVQISTSSVYGRSAVGDETMATAPVSPYGVTKLAGEHLVSAYVHSFGFPAVVLRYFSVYGPRQRPDMAYHRFIEQLRRGEPITVYDDGRQTRSVTFVSDCVRGTVQAISDAVPGEIYNIGGGEVITLLDAVTCVADALDVEPDIVFAPVRPGDQRDTGADTAKARATFGYRPEVTADQGLRAQVAWQLEHLPEAAAELKLA